MLKTKNKFYHLMDFYEVTTTDNKLYACMSSWKCDRCQGLTVTSHYIQNISPLWLSTNIIFCLVCKTCFEIYIKINRHDYIYGFFRYGWKSMSMTCRKASIWIELLFESQKRFGLPQVEKYLFQTSYVFLKFVWCHYI